MKQSEKDRYIQFGCGALVKEIDRLESQKGDVVRAAEVVLDYIKNDNPVPTAFIHALEESIIDAGDYND